MRDSGEVSKILTERELYRRGNLRHLHHAGQAKIHDRFLSSPLQLFVALCSRQFGKSHWGITLAVSQALRKPGAVIKMGTEFSTDLENFLLPNFEVVLETCPPDCRPIWKASKGKWIFPNGSQIHLIGLDRKPNGLRGAAVDLIIIEEAGFVSKLEYLYKSVIVPTTTHRPQCRIVLISTPPESLDHFFWTFVDRAALEGSLSVFTIDDNPMLGPRDIARIENEMGGRHTTAFKREYLCERIAEASRQLTPEFKRELHVGEFARPSYFNYLFKNEALDSGVRDLTVQLYSVYDFPTATLHVEDELVLQGNEVLTQTIYDRTVAAETALGYQRVSRYADNDNLILIQDLNVLGQTTDRHWSPTHKDSVEAGVNMIRILLKQNRIKIHPRCRTLIGTLETGLWNKRRDDFERTASYGHADALSALIYLFRNVNRHDNPIPHTFQMDLAHRIVFENQPLAGAAKSLKSAFKG